MKFSSTVCAFLALSLNQVAANHLRDDTRRVQVAVTTPSSISIGVNANTDQFTYNKIIELWQENMASAIAIISKKSAVVPVDIVIMNNEGDPRKAEEVQQDLIDQGVIAIVGPFPSKEAIPAGAISNERATTMISPSSTNPATTDGRPFVFRASFLDSFQGPMIAKYVGTQYNYTKAAIVSECGSTYSEGLAEFFKEKWEEDYGSVVSNSCLNVSTTSANDLGAQMSKAAEDAETMGAEFTFLPLTAEEALAFTLILRNYETAGQLIVGGDGAFHNATLLEANCGPYCEKILAVQVLSDANEATAAFQSSYSEKYATQANSVEALFYDSLSLVANAIENCGALTGDLAANRNCVNVAMANTDNFQGVIGNYTFDNNGDPDSKCVVFATVNANGAIVTVGESCPDK
jgi:branched-chain amino acid transport system substrate-binding protein